MRTIGNQGVLQGAAPSITCGKCGKLVEGLHIIRDAANDAVVLTVHCHGETDKMTLSGIDLLSNPSSSFSHGVAFQSEIPKIEDQKG